MLKMETPLENDAGKQPGRLTPRERFMSALERKQPDRVPFSWGFGPTPEMAVVLENFLAEKGICWEKLKQAASDKISTGPAYTGPPVPGGNTFTGIWGINLKRVEYAGGAYEEFTDFPLAGVSDPADLDRYPWPRPDFFDASGLAKKIEKANSGRQKAVVLSGGNPFEVYSWMTGLEEALVNVLINPDLVRTALDRISAYMAEKVRRCLENDGGLIDVVFYADDLGGQTGLLISRETYQQVVQPFHIRLTDVVREHAPGAKVMFHSDGAVFDVIPDLIDAGVDVLEAVQTDAAGMEPERLKKAYGNQISFHGAISVQSLLPYGTCAEVKAGCERLARVLGAGGGYVAAPSHAIQVGTPPENVLAMLEAVLGPDDFARAVKQAGG